MTIINGRMLFLPSKINKSKKLNIKNIAPSLFKSAVFKTLKCLLTIFQTFLSGTTRGCSSL